MFVLVIKLILFQIAYAAVQSPNCSVLHNTATEWTVDCENLKLKNLPTNLLNHPIVHLSLRKNEITSANFSNWKNLEYLDLSFNLIKTLNYSTFQSNVGLNFLNISYNNLITLNPDHFDQIPNLNTLDISGNFLLLTDEENIYKTINKTLYGGLKKLYANSLGLKNFPEYLFHHAYELTSLYLRNNHISILPKFPPSLLKLDLSGNNITELNLHSFHTSLELKVLIIEDNRYLTTIHHDAFHFLKNLEVLSLKGSIRLESIPKSSFYHIPLKSLSIANCNFKTLPPYFKHQFLELEHLDLRGNPWDCDSSLKWFNRLQTPEIDGLRCGSPRNITIADHYGSKISSQVLRNLLGVLIGFAIVLFGMAIWFAYDMEKKRRLEHPYTPLGKQNTFNNPIYISTVC